MDKLTNNILHKYFKETGIESVFECDIKQGCIHYEKGRFEFYNWNDMTDTPLYLPAETIENIILLNR